MNFLNGIFICKKNLLMNLVFCFVSVVLINPVSAQEKEQYILGENGQLEMIVHIIGEVKRPGEFRVIDSTNLMELISKAGGPTEYSNLNGVSIARIERAIVPGGKNGSARLKAGNRIIKYNVNNYLKKSTEKGPPVLKPGDIVLIPRNNWHRWRNAFTIIRDISVIASVYFLYRRSTN